MSKAKELAARIPDETKRFVDYWASLVVLCGKYMEEKGITKEQVRETGALLPTNGWEFNLRTIAKLEVLFQEPLIKILECKD